MRWQSAHPQPWRIARSTSPRRAGVQDVPDGSKSSSTGLRDSIYLSGIPAPRRRDWLANLSADPHFTFHLKHGVVADLPAVATVITDEAERRRLLAPLVDQFNERRGDDSEWPRAELDEWVQGSPLARVDFVEVG